MSNMEENIFKLLFIKSIYILGKQNSQMLSDMPET